MSDPYAVDVGEKGNSVEVGSVSTGRSSFEKLDSTKLDQKIVIIACLVGIIAIIGVIGYLYFRRSNSSYQAR